MKPKQNDTPPPTAYQLGIAIVASLVLHLFVITAPYLQNLLINNATKTTDFRLRQVAKPSLQAHLKPPTRINPQSTIRTIETAISQSSPSITRSAQTSANSETNLDEAIPSDYNFVPSQWLTKWPVLLDDLPELPADFFDHNFDPDLAITTLVLWINDTGSVVQVTVEDGRTPDNFSLAAIEVFKTLRFEPGEIDAQKVSCTIRIEASLSQFHNK